MWGLNRYFVRQPLSAISSRGNSIFIIAILALGLVSASKADDSDSAVQPRHAKLSDEDWVNPAFQPRYRFLIPDPSFKTLYPVTLVPASEDCSKGSIDAKGIPVPPYTFFRLARSEEPTAEDMLVNLYEVPKSEGETPGEAFETYFRAPLRLCVSESNRSDYIKRTGGFSPGILVIPFKYRFDGGDFSGDATIGPYVAYQYDGYSLLFTGGITQVSVVAPGGQDVESRQGLTVAAGLRYQVRENWDIGFIVGFDHLTGSEGDTWRHQNKPWLSFGIGVNFDQ